MARRSANVFSKQKRSWESDYEFSKRKRAAKHVGKQSLKQIARKEREAQRAFENAMYEEMVYAREVYDMEAMYADFNDEKGWD